MRLESLSCGSHTAKAVAHARYSLYYGGTGAIGFDFLAQAADVGPQDLRINGVISPPNFGEDLLDGEDFTVEPAQ